MRFLSIVSLLFALSANQLLAQVNNDDLGRISIHAFVPEWESLPSESRKLLETKLTQIIVNNGIADNEYSNRFILTAKTNVLSKDIVTGPPSRISQKVEITLMLGDIIEDKIYSQLSLSFIGIGQSEEKAYISAFKSISSSNPKIQSFIQEGKVKVLSYYQSHSEEIIVEAQKQANTQNYEEALLLLASIPDVCTASFNKAAKLAGPIFQDMINARGATLLQLAQNVWANNPNRDGAKEAVRYLSQINFAADSQSKASILLREITSRMNEIDNREWEHEVQVYQDNLEREKRVWEQNVKEYEDRVQTQRIFLNACRDVAISFAQNQPKVVNRTINYNRVLLW